MNSAAPNGHSDCDGVELHCGMLPFARLLALLEQQYGEPPLPPAHGPLEHILWENAVYLLPDTRRAEVYEDLRSATGLTIEGIEAAPDNVLLPIAQRGGMRPETRVFRWREIARIARTQFDGNLDQVLAWPPAKAKRALKQFPNIGEPGAEKILLFCGIAEGLPLESNGLRVLVRLGYGREQASYGAMYKSVQQDLAHTLPADPAILSLAHRLLREHGKTLCKDKSPACAKCPLRKGCDYAAKLQARLASPVL